MLLGLIPLLVMGAVLIVVLSLRLAAANAPLTEATGTATAVVTSTGLGEDGLQVAVEYTDESGAQQSGRLTLDGVQAIPLGQEIAVAYDPERPAVVYAPGDAVTSAVDDLSGGLLVAAVVLIATLAVTVVRLVRRRRLAATTRQQVQVHRERRRRGLSDRTWLVVEADRDPVWVPVYWDPALERIGEQPVTVSASGPPASDTLVAFEVYGATVWPSGRRRLDAPKAVERELGPPTGDVSMLRQGRADAALLLLAPVLGLLWAYVDESGSAGFVFASVLAAGLLFWLPAMYGSDPT